MAITYHISQGWLWLYDKDSADGFKLYFKEMEMNEKSNPTIRHYAGKSHLTYNTQKSWYEWIVKDIILTSHTDFSAFQDYTKDWMDDDYYFYMKTQRNSGGSFVEWDGDNTVYTVSIPKDGKKGIKKYSRGDDDIWLIKMLMLEQSG